MAAGRPYELTGDEAREFCSCVATQVDRIAAGQLDTSCIELDRIDEHGRRLIFVVTVSAEFGPHLKGHAEGYMKHRRAEFQRPADGQ